MDKKDLKVYKEVINTLLERLKTIEENISDLTQDLTKESIQIDIQLKKNKKNYKF